METSIVANHVMYFSSRPIDRGKMGKHVECVYYAINKCIISNR